MRFRSVLSLTAAFLLLVIPVSCAFAATEKAPEAASSTDWGKAIGRVYDAETGAPLVGATVVVQNNGVFTIDGKTVDRTNETGQYKCQAELGKVTSKISFGRLLNTGLIGLLSGGAKEVTRRVDLTRLNMRATADGYHPFEGVVMCKSIDAARFTVYMNPILLTKNSSPDVSTEAEGWGAVRIMDVTVEPAIARPKQEVTLTVRVQCPPAVSKPESLGEVWMPTVLLGLKAAIKPDKGQSGGVVTFTKKVKAKAIKAASYEIYSPWLVTSFDIAAGSASVENVTPVLPYGPWSNFRSAATSGVKSYMIQVVATDAEQKAAEIRLEAFRLLQSGESSQAAVKLKELCALPEARLWDCQALAMVSQSLHDYLSAVDALKRATGMVEDQASSNKGLFLGNKPEVWKLIWLGEYGRALILNGQPDKAISELAPVVEAVKEKDRPKKIPNTLMVTLADAYLRAGNLEQAKSVSDQLAKWPQGASSYPGEAEFRRAYRLANAEAGVKANPNDAQALAEYGRALIDLGRWEEAVEKLSAALKLDANLPAVRYDLGYALLRIQGTEAAKQNFEEALADAEKQVAIGEGQKKSKDFFAWHRLGVLLYRKASQQQAASDSAAADTLKRSQDVFTEALKCGRKGADVSYGSYDYTLGYTSPKVIAISGFAYPEANEDFVLLDSLQTLQTQPGDYLSHFNIANALYGLGQSDLAKDALEKSLALRPDFPEAKYVGALIAKQSSANNEAIALLNEALKSNPRHPHANQVLAELYAAEGDMAAAAERLAAHAKYY